MRRREAAIEVDILQNLFLQVINVLQAGIQFAATGGYSSSRPQSS
jgi:hypothetical protein